MTVAAAFSSFWQAVKINIKTRAPIAPDANDGDRVKGSFTGPILLIIGTPLGRDLLALQGQRKFVGVER
jgi:hypothetical protein